MSEEIHPLNVFLKGVFDDIIEKYVVTFHNDSAWDALAEWALEKAVFRVDTYGDPSVVLVFDTCGGDSELKRGSLNEFLDALFWIDVPEDRATEDRAVAIKALKAYIERLEAIDAALAK